MKKIIKKSKLRIPKFKNNTEFFKDLTKMLDARDKLDDRANGGGDSSLFVVAAKIDAAKSHKPGHDLSKIEMTVFSRASMSQAKAVVHEAMISLIRKKKEAGGELDPIEQLTLATADMKDCDHDHS